MERKRAEEDAQRRAEDAKRDAEREEARRRAEADTQLKVRYYEVNYSLPQAILRRATITKRHLLFCCLAVCTVQHHQQKTCNNTVMQCQEGLHSASKRILCSVKGVAA